MSRSTFILLAALISNSFVAQTEQKKDTAETKERPLQITFITPIGTNGIDAPKITNKVSLNMLVGVNGGVNGFEGAGLINVTMKNMKGLQGAGLGNAVLGDVSGLQGAGFFNYSGGNLQGGQGAGFVNVNKGTLLGIQGAGFVNVNGDSLKGAQLAGFCNSNLGNVTGVQGAGFCNYANGKLEGIQAAGFCNTARGDVKGAQLAGFTNIAKGHVEGVQASGFFNYAKKVKGVQLGYINIADSVDGASIGFLSIVKHGLHQVELSADELMYANIAFRTGTHRFYNVFSVGAAPKSGDFLWQVGYGIGTSFTMTEKLRSELQLSGHHISSRLFFRGTSERYTLYAGAEYKLANKCFIAAGPTFNLYFSDTYLPDYSTSYSKIPPYSFLNETNSYGFNFKAWVGAKVAIRFL